MCHQICPGVNEPSPHVWGPKPEGRASDLEAEPKSVIQRQVFGKNGRLLRGAHQSSAGEKGSYTPTGAGWGRARPGASPHGGSAERLGRRGQAVQMSRLGHLFFLTFLYLTESFPNLPKSSCFILLQRTPQMFKKISIFAKEIF